MSTEPREFWIIDKWNSPSKVERITLDQDPGPLPMTCDIFHVIEHSAYQALEQKLAVAQKALEFYGDCTRLMLDKNTPNHPLFKSVSIADNGQTAKEALALINSDAKKEQAP